VGIFRHSAALAVGSRPKSCIGPIRRLGLGAASGSRLGNPPKGPKTESPCRGLTSYPHWFHPASCLTIPSQALSPHLLSKRCFAIKAALSLVPLLQPTPAGSRARISSLRNILHRSFKYRQTRLRSGLRSPWRLRILKARHPLLLQKLPPLARRKSRSRSSRSQTSVKSIRYQSKLKRSRANRRLSSSQLRRQRREQPFRADRKCHPEIDSTNSPWEHL
jgi:hypothetical protein